MKITRILKNIIVVFISLLLVLSYIFIEISVPTSASEKPKNILILNSYHTGYQWTDDQCNSICEVLKQSEIDIISYIEYLDWKRFPSEENLNQLNEYYKYKYSNKEIDLIITTDDAAAKFALEHRLELFSDAPIVFGGISKDVGNSMLNESNNITGVYEAIDAAGTIRAVKQLFPGVEEVYFIHDNTETGYDRSNTIKETLTQIDSNIKQFDLNNVPLMQICEKLSKLSENSIAIIDSYSSDATGLSLPAETFAEIITDSSAVPVFICGETAFGYGSIGGSILSAELHGSAIAALALRVLNGEDINTISPIEDESVFYGFDYNVLKQYDISLDELPEGSIVINKPFSIIETYKTQFYIIIAVFLLLFSLIGYLLINIRLRRKAENKLRDNNEELTALYEEVAASEESLKVNFDELMKNQNELRISEEKYRLIVESSMDVIWEGDFNTNSKIFSDKITDILGYSKDEIKTFEDWNRIIHPDDYDRVTGAVNRALSGEKPRLETMEYRVRCKSGEYKWVVSNRKGMYDEAGNLVRIFGAYTDITELKQQQMKIHKLAYYDLITGLPNRVLLQNEIFYRIEKNKNIDFAMFFIDLDNFKIVNDSFGHIIGDKLLSHVAERLMNINRDKCTAYRLGGDEFVVLYHQFETKEKVESCADKIIKRLSEPYGIDNNLFHISASIGIVCYPENGLSYDELLKNADTAMYQSKGIGKATFSFYNAAMGDVALSKIKIQNNLYKAIEKNEFILYYQPLININSGEIKGLEALIRWVHPIDGFIPPDEFIAVAEESGMIIEIGKWVMENACMFAKQLMNQGYKDFHISVNVSAIQLVQKDFLPSLTKILDEIKLPTSYLMIEITESILMESFDLVIKVLEEIKQMGINIALDDFGCGYSSLTYLKKLPIDTLKIDKTFISDILSVDDEACITGSIISLAKQLGLNVIAEGVEKNEQLEYLRKYKCDLFQGYLKSKPVPENDVLKLLGLTLL